MSSQRSTVMEITSAHAAAKRIAEGMDGWTEVDAMAGVQLREYAEKCQRMVAFWEKELTRAEEALDKLGMPEPDEPATGKTIMDYIDKGAAG